METKLILYRGDYEKIGEFKTNKTDKYCLCGQGIYLTADKSVAETYRTKGSRSYIPEGNICLFNGKAANRSDAYAQAYDFFCNQHYVVKTHNQFRDLKKLEQEVIKRKYRDEYDQLLMDGKITVECYYVATGMFGANRERRFNVTYSVSKVGYITSFEFQESFITNNVVHIDKPNNDKGFWEIVYEAGIDIGTPADTIEDFVAKNLGKKIDAAIHYDNRPAVYRKLILHLKRYGIVGFEYGGGVRTGFGRKHRVFSLWEDEFVNAHKVQRIR